MEFKAENFEVTVDNKIIYVISAVAIVAVIGSVIKTII